jgi:hypothetical protein
MGGRHESGAPATEVAKNPAEALRNARTRALIRHALAADAILDAKREGHTPSVEQRRELTESRNSFEAVRPYGWQDAEAAYNKDNSLAYEAATGLPDRAIRALQLETEIRTAPARRADRFVERWKELGQTSQRQYEMGDMSGYEATRSVMGNMAKGLERDPQIVGSSAVTEFVRLATSTCTKQRESSSLFVLQAPASCARRVSSC